MKSGEQRLQYLTTTALLKFRNNYSRMTSGCNEIKQSMHTVVTESWVTLDSVFFGENIIVLAFQITNNFLEADIGNG